MVSTGHRGQGSQLSEKEQERRVRRGCYRGFLDWSLNLRGTVDGDANAQLLSKTGNQPFPRAFAEVIAGHAGGCAEEEEDDQKGRHEH